MNETTFENVRIGDRVWDTRYGWGIVARIDSESSYSLLVEFDDFEDTYLPNGCVNKLALRTLFWDEIKFEAPPRPKRKEKKVVEGWISIWDCSGKLYGTAVRPTQEEANDGRSNGTDYLGEPFFIHHEYEVEE